MIYVQVLSILGSLASLVGLYFTIIPDNHKMSHWEFALIASFVLLSVLSGYVEYRRWMRTRPVVCKTKPEIRSYMYRWIKDHGRTVIFTRDMSWVKDVEMHEMLRDKARSNELTLVLQKPITLSSELERCGAEVITYEDLNVVPTIRFTIVNEGRVDAKVAIAHPDEEAHRIYEYKMGAHPIFHMAHDLVSMLRKNQR